MHLTQNCVTSVLDFTHELWTFVNSKEGQLLLWLVLASHGFAHCVRDTGSHEAAEFSAAVLTAMLLFLLALATETGFVSRLLTDFQKCTNSANQVAGERPTTKSGRGLSPVIGEAHASNPQVPKTQ